jgi:penicillin amidase
MKRRVGIIPALASAIALSACAAFGGLPAPASTEERLAMIPLSGAPLERPVAIHWNDYQVPFIEAETDRDGAFALGLVHAHLRLGQMEILRRVSQARLREVAGPIPGIRDAEHALRILNFGKTSAEVYARMPERSKAFLDSFVAGINFYQQNVERLPHEYALLGIDRESWRPEEVLTLSRLASVDVSWLTWFRLIELRDRPDWPEIWSQALAHGTASIPSFPPEEGASLHLLNDILSSTARTGSNSFAVGGSKTSSRSSIIASDPHLGIDLPNIWVLAGLKSPSYHVAGLMVPGLPFVAVGRNADIAWGGTNMRSAASDLIDISDVPAEQIVSREENANVRWWFDDTFTVRESPHGPVISDAEIINALPGETFALKWIGHRPSDEVTAMLDVNRARNWDEFRTSLEPFAISAQNFVYADREGNIGQLTTTHIPKRSMEMPRDIVRPLSDAAAWDTILTSRDLPSAYNPADGFVASANNKPAETSFPIGYFFSGDDRVLRMREMLSPASEMSVADVQAIQSDTYMISAKTLCEVIVARAEAIADLSEGAARTLEILSAWNGRFDGDSQGAVAFQASAAILVPQLVDETQQTIIETGGTEYLDYAKLIEGAAPGSLEPHIVAALEGAQAALAAYPNWGAMHKLVLEHNFSMIPLIGGRYRFVETPWPGSTDTLWRASHDLSTEEVNAGFGAQARHISDMADLDSNWFALVGGNDGWINSENFIDQIEAFRTSAPIPFPMRPETVRTQFRHTTNLSP